MKGFNGFIIGALLIGVLVLGYLYYGETKDDASIKIEVPKVTVD